MRRFAYETVERPDVFEENRLPAHSDHLYALADGTPARVSLNGRWHFHYAENWAGTVPDFFSRDLDCRDWPTIPVPAHIQLQGWGRPQYVNMQYPWDGWEDLRPGEVPVRHAPVGSYVTYFTLPPSWAGRPVYVSFQGAESGLAVWCNGAYVGYGEDGFTPSEFDLTPWLTEGENKLAVQVFQYTSASWCEDQDFFRFSGLFREVYLYTVPAAHLWDLKLTTELDEDFSHGVLHIRTRTQGASACLCRLYDGARLAAEGAGREDVALAVAGPKLWSAEKPRLYRLEIQVLDSGGRTAETVTEDVGFRRFEIRDGRMLLNGKRIVFRGVNRHEFSAAAGRCVTEEEMERDVITMKRHNINAVRTSHYPDQTAFYRLCDRYGLYLIDEMDLESHGSWGLMDLGRISPAEHVPGDDPRWEAMVLSRAEAMYQRDKNHPSVLIWSLGNESFGGKNLLAASRYFREADSRPVHYESIIHDPRYPETSDILSSMYLPAERIRDMLAADSSRPAISCEYGHAMGNSFGGQKRYIDLAEEVPAYQGGFIWDYIDQALTKRDRYGRPFQAYGGDFDDRPTDYEFSGDGLVYSDDRTPSPKMQEVKYLYQGLDIQLAEGRARVTNRYLFTDAAEFDCVVQLHRQGVLVAQETMEVSSAPGETADCPLPLWPETLDDEYTVTVSFRLREDTPWAPAGHEVAFGQCVLGQLPPAVCPQGDLEVIDGGWNIGVIGADFGLLFSKTQGGLVSYRFGGRELLKAAPRPNFWRAPTDNDRGACLQGRFAQWKLASLYGAAKPLPYSVPDRRDEVLHTLRRGEDWVQVTFRHLLPTRPGTECALSYRVFADGTVEATLDSDAGTVLGPMPAFGLLLKLDGDFDRLRWYGRGPEETYRDRKLGGRLGIYENRVADNMSRYLRPQECGSHADVRWASVTDETGLGLLFTCPEGMDLSALPYTPEELESAEHPNELPPVHSTVVRAGLQMGVGADNSWGAVPQPEAMLPAGPLSFRVTFRGIRGAAGDGGRPCPGGPSVL